MRLTEWLNHLFSRHSIRIDLGLDRIEKAYHLMLHDFPKCPVILLGGTNGKGSVSYALESTYRLAGYRTGLYTSPHLFDFRERFRVSGEMLAESVWVDVFERLASHDCSESLTFFEYVTLASLLLAESSSLDVLILEVGLGGRLDAVNVVPRELSIITNVDLDHQAYLGDTREAIAKEKAGIISSAVPVILGEPDLPQCVMDQALLKGSLVVQAGEQYRYQQRITDRRFEYASLDRQSFCLDLPRGLLPSNAATAVAAIDTLQIILPASDEHIKEGISGVSLPGRQQQLTLNGVNVILDVAHNPQAVKSLVDQALPVGSKKLWCVFSALQGKDMAGMLSAFEGLDTSWKLFELSSDRAMPLGDLCAVFDSDYPYYSYQAGQLGALWLQLWEDVKPEDTILIFGSFQVIAALQPYINES